MKKQTSKSKKAVEAKKFRKNLELKLQEVFSQTILGFGKVAKADAIIEKFAKKLTKKVVLKPAEQKEKVDEELKSETTQTEKVAKTKAKPAKK